MKNGRHRGEGHLCGSAVNKGCEDVQQNFHAAASRIEPLRQQAARRRIPEAVPSVLEAEFRTEFEWYDPRFGKLLRWDSGMQICESSTALLLVMSCALSLTGGCTGLGLSGCDPMRPSFAFDKHG